MRLTKIFGCFDVRKRFCGNCNVNGDCLSVILSCNVVFVSGPFFVVVFFSLFLSFASTTLYFSLCQTIMVFRTQNEHRGFDHVNIRNLYARFSLSLMSYTWSLLHFGQYKFSNKFCRSNMEDMERRQVKWQWNGARTRHKMAFTWTNFTCALTWTQSKSLIARYMHAVNTFQCGL